MSVNITAEQQRELQQLADEFNTHSGQYAGERFINPDVGAAAGKAGRSVMKYMAELGLIDDTAFGRAYKKAQDDEADNDEADNDEAAKEWE